jgi:predicted RND superfamily exporter protein
LKLLVNTLSGAVRRFPAIVLIAAVVVSLGLGGAGGDFFAQEEGGNDAFAPDAPELVAAERIAELFGEDSSESILQVIVTAEDGDVIDADGLAAVSAVSEAIAGGPLAGRLSERPDRPAIVSYLFPVQQAIQDGEAPPAPNDAEVKGIFTGSLTQLPPEQAGFVRGLLPEAVDASDGASPRGLVLVFVQGVGGDTGEFYAFVDLQADAADGITAAPLPAGHRAEPFSFELVFSTQDEFLDEVNRLFAAAGFIIVAILAIVFVILPAAGTRERLVAVAGFAAVFVAVGLLVLEVVPPLVTLAVVALVLLTWTFTTKGLRRTAADTMMTMVAILFAINWVAGAWKILYDEPNPMTQIIPILLIGLGVDYSIHLNSRYRDEVASGHTVSNGVGVAIRTVGVALVLATVTTAVGFLTNITNDIRALQQFGVLSAVGIVASFVLMLTLVPSVRLLLDRRAEARGTFEPATLEGGESRALPRVIGRTSWLPENAAVYTVVVALVLGGVGAFGVTKLEAKFSFLDFVPTSSPVRDTFRTLLDEFGGGFGETTQVLVEGDLATAESWNALAQSVQNAGDTPNVLTFGDLPSVDGIHTLAARLADQTSEGFNPAVGQAAAQVGLGPDLTVSPGADVTPLFEAVAAAAPDQFSRLVNTDGGYNVAQFEFGTQAGEEFAGQLRVDLNEDFTPARNAGLDATATSDEIINDVIVTTLRDSQVSSLFITLAAALVLLVVNFLIEARRPFLGVVTTVPVVLVVLWAFGVMAGLGIPFGPVTATIAALAIGIGIPYMIHITHRYQEDRLRYDDPNEAIRSTLTHTGGALAGSALTTMAGFGILVTSTTIPFQQLGFVTAYTIGLALLAGILVLPSMLALWDRWHRNRGEESLDRAQVEHILHGVPPGERQVPSDTPALD